MAMDNFREKQRKTVVLQDLDLSSDSESEEIQEVSISPKNIQSYEDAILIDDDDVEMVDETVKTVSTIQPRNNASGFAMNVRNKSSSPILAAVKNDEVHNSNETIAKMNNARSLINYGNVEPLDFENIIIKRERKVPTPVSPIQSRKFKRPNCATRKVYNANPRDSITLDEDIGRRVTSPITHTRSNVQESQDSKRMEKLKQGLQTVAQESIFNNAEGNSENNLESYFPQFKPDPWSSLQILIKYGYNICCTTMILDKDGELTLEENDRLYRCSISCRANNADITGVCEAAKMMIAMHGAAANVIKKMIACLGLPKMTSVSADIDETVLIDEKALTAVVNKLEECEQNVYIQQYCAMERIQGFRFYTHTLYINSIKFEATSNINAVYARLSAIQKAYEEIIKERCPRFRMFEEEECTQDESCYRVIQSHASMSFDLTQSKLMSEEFKSKNLSGKAGGFRGRKVKVCNEGPEICFDYP